MVAVVLGPFGAAAGITGVVRGAGVAGEYGTHPGYFLAMCAAAAVDCLQVDVSRAGGYTGWLRAAAIAAAHELEVSGHCVPQQGAFAQAAIPNFRHLEWFHDPVRIESMLFDGVLEPVYGQLAPDPREPGNAVVLQSAVHRVLAALGAVDAVPGADREAKTLLAVGPIARPPGWRTGLPDTCSLHALVRSPDPQHRHGTGLGAGRAWALAGPGR